MSERVRVVSFSCFKRHLQNHPHVYTLFSTEDKLPICIDWITLLILFMETLRQYQRTMIFLDHDILFLNVFPRPTGACIMGMSRNKFCAQRHQGTWSKHALAHTHIQSMHTHAHLHTSTWHTKEDISCYLYPEHQATKKMCKVYGVVSGCLILDTYKAPC